MNGLCLKFNYSSSLSDVFKCKPRSFNLKFAIIIHNNILERHGNSILLNPGSPALPNRKDKRPTVAVITDDKIEVFDLNDGEVLMNMAL